MAEVGILVIDDDLATQRALKNVLDTEGWRVRIVPHATHAMAELAGSAWSLVIINVALTDLRGPLFAILKELAQADQNELVPVPDEAEVAAAKAAVSETFAGEREDPPPPPRKRVRVLFLVPPLSAAKAQPVLEREGLPYSLKPYHLHDFLEKVSELLVESGAIEQPIRAMRDFSARKRRVARRTARDSRRGAMFATREDYQMTEEEMVEWERQEEEERKKREKERRESQHLG